MRNILIVPTDKPSKLFLNKRKNELFINEEFDDSSPKIIAHHIYITSDEEIKEGDWVYHSNKNIIFQVNSNKAYSGTQNITLSFAKKYDTCKKIILTTDSELIADGVQAIDYTFLEWFVKNPTCEWVAVTNLYGDFNPIKHEYRIIIPQQKEVGESVIDVIGKCGNCGVEFHIHKDIMDVVEKNEELQKFDEEVKLQVIQTKEDADIFSKELENPSEPNEKLKKAFKKQETLEEAAKNYLNSGKTPNDYKSFIEGANWQSERMYSEEETYRLLHNLMSSVSLGLLKINDDMDLKEWFNKNKK